MRITLVLLLSNLVISQINESLTQNIVSKKVNNLSADLHTSLVPLLETTIRAKHDFKTALHTRTVSKITSSSKTSSPKSSTPSDISVTQGEIPEKSSLFISRPTPSGNTETPVLLETISNNITNTINKLDEEREKKLENNGTVLIVTDDEILEVVETSTDPTAIEVTSWTSQNFENYTDSVDQTFLQNSTNVGNIILTNVPFVSEESTTPPSYSENSTLPSKDISPSTAENGEKSTLKTDSLIKNEFNSSGIIEDTPVLPVEEIISVSVRKCCAENQFFNLIDASCKNSNLNFSFEAQTKTLIYGFHAKNLDIHPGLLQVCPNSTQPPGIINDLINSSIFLLPTGEIYDDLLKTIFGPSEYCLELVGHEASSSLLNLVFCPKTFREDNFADYELEQTNNSHIIRKCCEENEYYDVDQQSCTAISDPHQFGKTIQDITFTANPVELDFITGTLQQCPDGKSVPSVTSPVTSDNFRLKESGEMIDISTGIHHNVSHYCMELVGIESSGLSLTIIFCPETYKVKKCCEVGHYFEESQLDCLPHVSEKEKNENILNYFHKDANTYATIYSGELSCESSFPVVESADNLHLYEGQLCNQNSCFNQTDYCVELMSSNNQDLQPKSFYCKKEIFLKCCKSEHILSDEGCISHSGGNSVLLRQLLNTRSFKRAFDSKKCRKGPGILLDDTYSEYLNWWVNEDGTFLNIKSESQKLKIDHYCVDDYMDKNGKIIPGAYICEEEVAHLIPNEQNFLRYSQRGSIGKCCHQNTESVLYYYSTVENKCKTVPNSNQTLFENEFLQVANFTGEHFHDFPVCPLEHDVFYHAFPFKPGTYDYVRFNGDRTIHIVKKLGRCVDSEVQITDRDMCVEFVLDDDGQLAPKAFMCAYTSIANIYTEKYILVTALLGISIICLFMTLIALFTVRVRRGLVTIRKVNTLPGRMLVSFVCSNLVGITALVLSQFDISTVESPGCYTLAGFIQFFNLATFCWNTSICLEWLLLTIHVQLSENIKYTLHSLWAWGFPLFMTILVFLFDRYRDSLPCWVVIPQLGVTTCFFPNTDNAPILVYFYLPIFITLVANISFLIAAKMLRRCRLKRLEIGKLNNFSGASPRNSADKTQGRSGMRIHHSQNSKAESIRLVTWTGGIWFLECLGYVVTRFLIIHTTHTRWFEYLWYIPTCLNSLRGVGIFVIIVLTPERRKEIGISIGRFKSTFRSKFDQSTLSSRSRTNKTSFSVDFSNKKFSFDDSKRRNMSVTTVISTLSSSFNVGSKTEDEPQRRSSIASYISSKFDTIRKKSTAGGTADRKQSFNNNERPKRKFGMIRSVSQIGQIDRRISTASSTGSFLDELEMQEDSVRRKYSMNPSAHLQLPKLQEEESFYDEEPKQFKDSLTVSPHLKTNEDRRVTKKSLNVEEMPHILEDSGSEGSRLSRNHVTGLNESPSNRNRELTLTELDIDLEPLDLDIPVQFIFPNSSVNSISNHKKSSAASWTDIDLGIPDIEDDSATVDV